MFKPVEYPFVDVTPIINDLIEGIKNKALQGKKEYSQCFPSQLGLHLQIYKVKEYFNNEGLKIDICSPHEYNPKYSIHLKWE